MENASKALIIAGAILLSILLVSLGVMIFSQAQDTVRGSNLDATQIQTFNSQWSSYVGNNKSAGDVKTMIEAVVANNASEKNSKNGRYVSIINGTTTYSYDGTKSFTGATTKKKLSSEASNLINLLAAGSRYTVTSTIDDNSGLITALTYK